MNEFPILKNPRLLLSAISSVDLPEIVKYAGNEKVAETTLNIPHPYEEKDAIFWINSAQQGFQNKTQFTFGIRLNLEESFIGGIGLKINQRFNLAELGYWIAEPFWNYGYATEALGALLKFGFKELNLHKIFAVHLIENPASGKVMIKNGMIKEGVLKDHTRKGDIYRSIIQYRLLKEEFLELDK